MSVEARRTGGLTSRRSPSQRVISHPGVRGAPMSPLSRLCLVAVVLCLTPSLRAEDDLAKYDGTIKAADREHWSFRPVRRVTPPAVRDAAWGRNPIDSFLLARLEARDWKPAAPAEKRALLR